MKRFADEFRSPLESGFVKDNVKDRHIVRIIERIVKNPEIFIMKMRFGAYSTIQ